MIYLISDIHGDKNFKGLQDYLRIAKDDDLLIVLGDVSLEFENTVTNRDFTEYFLSLKKNIAFLDGNHENFSYLNSFPEEKWNGGKIHRLSEHIVHLQRGNVYRINGKSIFTFGGCKSSAKWKEAGLWHPEETASDEECNLAKENLQKANFSVDYILTHKHETDPNYHLVDMNLYQLTKFIKDNVSYKKWYFGHSHIKRIVDEKHTYIYDDLIPI